VKRVRVTMKAEPISFFLNVPDDTDVDVDGVLYAIDCDPVVQEDFKYALDGEALGGLDYGYVVTDVKNN